MSNFGKGFVDDVSKAIPHQLFITDSDFTSNDYQMDVADLNVFLTIVAATMTLTLPPVALAAGRTYTVTCIARTAGQVTIRDYRNSGDAGGDSYDFGEYGAAQLQLDAEKDRVKIYSNGVSWFVDSEAIA